MHQRLPHGPLPRAPARPAVNTTSAALPSHGGGGSGTIEGGAKGSRPIRAGADAPLEALPHLPSDRCQRCLISRDRGLSHAVTEVSRMQ